jgi:hypothetical protein
LRKLPSSRSVRLTTNRLRMTGAREKTDSTPIADPSVFERHTFLLTMVIGFTVLKSIPLVYNIAQFLNSKLMGSPSVWFPYTFWPDRLLSPAFSRAAVSYVLVPYVPVPDRSPNRGSSRSYGRG